MPQFPDEDELIQLDDKLAHDGIPVIKRPGLAWLRWIAERGIDFSEGLAMSDWFDARYAELHPSVNFANAPFSFLCVSARGIAYETNPPIIYGTRYVNPLRWTKIQASELERIHTKDPTAFFEMYYQVADCFDLFLGYSDFRPASADARGMIAVGTSQLETTARRLVSASLDASMSQAMCLVVEMIFKAVLVEAGIATTTLKNKFGHNLLALANELAALRSAPNDAELMAVAATMPNYSGVRYNPPAMNANQEQDLFRRALFLSAEAIRRTRTSSMYREMAIDPTVGPRLW